MKLKGISDQGFKRLAQGICKRAEDVFKRTFDESPEYRDMADALGWDLWGYAPNGDLRIGLKGDPDPSFTVTHEELADKFGEQFDIVSAGSKWNKNRVKIVPKGSGEDIA